MSVVKDLWFDPCNMLRSGCHGYERYYRNDTGSVFTHPRSLLTFPHDACDEATFDKYVRRWERVLSTIRSNEKITWLYVDPPNLPWTYSYDGIPILGSDPLCDLRVFCGLLKKFNVKYRHVVYFSMLDTTDDDIEGVLTYLLRL